MESSHRPRVMNRSPSTNDEEASLFVPQNPAQLQAPARGEETVEIIRLSADNLPVNRVVGLEPKTYAVLTMAGQSQQTQISAGSAPHWEGPFIFKFEANDSVLLKVEVRRVPTFRQEKVLGMLELGISDIRSLLGSTNRLNISPFEFTGELTMVKRVALDPQPSVTIEFQRSAARTPSPNLLEEAASAVLEAESSLAQMQELPLPIHAIKAIPTAFPEIEQVAQAVPDVLAPLKKVLNSLDAFVKIVDDVSEIYPYAKVAWTILSVVYKVAKAQQERDDAMSELLETMSTTLAFTRQADDARSMVTTHRDFALALAIKAKECAFFIREYAKTTGFLRRPAKSLFADVSGDINRFKNDFNILRQNLDMGAILSVAAMFEKGLSEPKLDLIETRGPTISADHQGILNQLMAISSWNSHHVCLENTRASVLDDITRWVHDVPEHGPNAPFFLSGGAGTGKSSVANSIAAQY
ncbi:hypothetical protein BOTBODRAFT_36671, partial [Botryobasidium botryosum FD-172 SS1]